MIRTLPPVDDTIEINGVKFSGVVLAQFLRLVTNPRPGCWYKFERVGDLVQVSVRQDESFGASHGN